MRRRSSPPAACNKQNGNGKAPDAADAEGAEGGGHQDHCCRSRADQPFHDRREGGGLDQTLAGPGPYTVFVPDDAAFGAAPAGTFDIDPENRPQLTGILTNLVLPGTVMIADIDKAIDAAKGKAMLATMSGSTLTATKDGGKTVLTDSAGHKATISQGDEQYTNGVVHHIDAVLMPAKRSAPLAVGQKAGK